MKCKIVEVLCPTISKGHIANVHGVKVSQAAQEESCPALAVLRGAVVGGGPAVASCPGVASFSLAQCPLPQEGGSVPTARER